MKNITLKNGFHLFEILIVLAIISILFAFAIPQYDVYLIRSNRLQAANQLMKLALAMEQYHLANNTYEDINLNKLNFPQVICNHQYQLIVQAKKSEYLLMAKPLGKQATKDTLCGSLILDSYGEKRITGTGNMVECW